MLRLQPPAAETSRELKQHWDTREKEVEEVEVSSFKLFSLISVDEAATHLLAIRLSCSTLLSLISSPPGQKEVQGHQVDSNDTTATELDEMSAVLPAKLAGTMTKSSASQDDEALLLPPPPPAVAPSGLGEDRVLRRSCWPSASDCCRTDSQSNEQIVNQTVRQ